MAFRKIVNGSPVAQGATTTTDVADLIGSAISEIIDAAPVALDTLNELAAALGDDANFASTVTNSLSAKAPIVNPTFTGTVSGVTKTHVGLGNVDNTSDTNKPVSTATQTALDLKANIASPTFTGTVSGNASESSAAGDAAKAIGFKGIPASSAGASGAYTLTAADAGELVYTTTTRTVTIPSNASVPFEIGTSIVFISGAGATTTIAISSDTMLLAGPGTTGSRTLAAHGMATAVKVAATTWYISGNGLT